MIANSNKIDLEFSGGNFEDGFVTGVFSRAFNDNSHKNNPPKPWKIDDSREFYKEYGNQNGLSSAETNAVQHCGTSCSLSFEVGEGLAWVLGQGREIISPHNYPNDGALGFVNSDGLKDMHNNAAGIDASRTVLSPLYCPGACLDALDRGGLVVDRHSLIGAK